MEKISPTIVKQPTKVFVVGGWRQLVTNNIAPNLRELGLKVDVHNEVRNRSHMPTKVPSGCKVVLVLMDQLPGGDDARAALRDLEEDASKIVDVIFIRSTSKASQFIPALAAFGFRKPEKKPETPPEDPNAGNVKIEDPPEPALDAHGFEVPKLVKVGGPFATITGKVVIQGVEYTPMVVTPELAKKFLAEMEPNRSLSDSLVISIAEDIINDRWRANNAGIAFNERSRMVDGQHRMQAVVLADKPVEVLVARGLTREAWATIDTGRPRSLGDQYRMMDGEHHGRKLGSVLFYLGMLDGKFTDKTRANKALTDEVMLRHTDGIACIRPHSGGKVAGIGRACVLAAVAYAYPVNPEKVAVFLERLLDGVMLDDDDPIYAVREILLGNAIKRLHSRPEQFEIAVRVLRGIQAHLAGEKLKQIKSATQVDGAREFFRAWHDNKAKVSP